MGIIATCNIEPVLEQRKKKRKRKKRSKALTGNDNGYVLSEGVSSTNNTVEIATCNIEPVLEQRKKKRGRKKRSKALKGNDNGCDLSECVSSTNNTIQEISPTLSSPDKIYSSLEPEIVQTHSSVSVSKEKSEAREQRQKQNAMGNKNADYKLRDEDSSGQPVGADPSSVPKNDDHKGSDNVLPEKNNVKLCRKRKRVRNRRSRSIMSSDGLANTLVPSKEDKKDVSLSNPNEVQTKGLLQQPTTALVIKELRLEDSLCCSRKKLLILDANGLLVDFVPCVPEGYKPDIRIGNKAVFKRPFCDDFLQFCFERFEVGIWSSRTRENLYKLIDFLMGDSRRKLLFCWDRSHCTKTRFKTIEDKHKPLVLKELKQVWEKHKNLPWNKGKYNKSNTLLLDDSPYKGLCNPEHTAIFPPPYRFKDREDTSLGPGGDLRVYLESLSMSKDVQKYIQQNPFGQPRITKSSPNWSLYRKIKYCNS